MLDAIKMAITILNHQGLLYFAPAQKHPKLLLLKSSFPMAHEELVPAALREPCPCITERSLQTQKWRLLLFHHEGTTWIGMGFCGWLHFL